jgi:hypothetical protein
MIWFRPRHERGAGVFGSGPVCYLFQRRFAQTEHSARAKPAHDDGRGKCHELFQSKAAVGLGGLFGGLVGGE